MTLQELLDLHPSFTHEHGIYYQNGLDRAHPFEASYISLREKENRLYTDDIVKKLPEPPADHPLRKEWLHRKASTEKLIAYLKKRKNSPNILELGCGNGWLSHHLAELDQSIVWGIDRNERELLQAARVFNTYGNLSFLYADVFTAPLPQNAFDFVILASSMQYFDNVKTLLNTLLSLLAPGGEIHIIDSPIYRSHELHQARQRSMHYFQNMRSDMHDFYHHHDWESLSEFKVTILYDPHSITSRIRRAIIPYTPPFPWIRVTL